MIRIPIASIKPTRRGERTHRFGEPTRDDRDEHNVVDAEHDLHRRQGKQCRERIERKKRSVEREVQTGSEQHHRSQRHEIEYGSLANHDFAWHQRTCFEFPASIAILPRWQSAAK